MNDPILAARKRAQSYWYRDGLAEIDLGVFCLLQAAIIPFQGSWIAALVYLVVLVGFVRIMRMARERITYPRSGYMAPSESMRKARAWAVAVIILVSIAYAVACWYRDVIGWDPHRWGHSLTAVAGLVTFAISAYLNMRHRMLRYLLVGFFSLILGVVVTFECSEKLGLLIWDAGVGCAWLCAGGFALRNFLQHTPLIEYQT
jgi:drug/metabolite transporter (DMT)-like permease